MISWRRLDRRRWSGVKIASCEWRVAVRRRSSCATCALFILRGARERMGNCPEKTVISEQSSVRSYRSASHFSSPVAQRSAWGSALKKQNAKTRWGKGAKEIYVHLSGALWVLHIAGFFIPRGARRRTGSGGKALSDDQDQETGKGAVDGEDVE